MTPDKVGDVERLILSTLEKLSRDGIDADTIAASLNTIEFALREKNTGHFPRGLAIMLDGLNDWLYDKDPIESLSFAGPLEKVKKTAAENPRLFSKLIDSLLLRNSHRTTVALLPLADANREREEAEKTMLARAQVALDAQKLQEIERTAEMLKVLQDTPDSPEALATIPVLSLDDIPKEAPVLPSEPLDLGNGGAHGAPDEVRAYYHELATSGILYLDLGFDFGALESKLLPYVSLLGAFCSRWAPTRRFCAADSAHRHAYRRHSEHVGVCDALG